MSGPINHVTYIEGPDSAGHWEWYCSAEGCHENATGYELPADVITAAKEHGRLSADSMIPQDQDEH